MAWRENASIKYEEQKPPTAVLEGDSRLDGRGYEMFRSVCEFDFLRPIHPALVYPRGLDNYFNSYKPVPNSDDHLYLPRCTPCMQS